MLKVRELVVFIARLAHLRQIGIKPATLYQLTIEQPFLFRCKGDAPLKIFQMCISSRFNPIVCQELNLALVPDKELRFHPSV